MLLTALLLAGAGFGCDGGPTAPEAEKPGEVRTPVARVELSRAELTLVVGDSAQVEVTARSAAGEALTGRVIEWSSGNAAVAAVSATGVIRALAPGAVVITATSEGRSATLVLTVRPPPAVRVVLPVSSVAMMVDGRFQFDVAVFDAAGNRVASPVLSVSSADMTVALILGWSLTGTVTVAGVREGTTTITVRVMNPPGLSPEFAESSMSVTVGPPQVTRVDLTPSTASVAAGDSVALSAAAFSGSGTRVTSLVTTWRSSAPAIATVSAAGVVRGVAPGTSIITAEVGGHVDSATVTVTPAGLPVDTTTPAVVSLSFTPTAVDVTTGPADITARVHLRDAGSGIDPSHSWIGLVVIGRPGDTLCIARTLVSGTVNDGTWECTMRIPQGAWPGQWVLTALSAQDLAGNIMLLGAEESRRFSPGVTVTNTNADVTPPTVTSVSFNPDSVDVTGHDASVTITVAASDAQSDVVGALSVAVIESPTGDRAACNLGTLVSGTLRNGRWSCTVNIPQWTRVGEWTVQQVMMFDAEDNRGMLSADELRAFPTLTVTGPAPDVTAPSVTGITFSPGTVQKGASGADVTITFTATDDLRGVNGNEAHIAVVSPSRTQSNGCSGAQLVSGTATNGTWRCVMHVYPGHEVGTWVIDQVRLSDVLGNTFEVTGDAARARFPASIVIQP